MTPLKAVLALLITRRLTSLVVDDKITEPLRNWVIESSDPGSQLAYLVTCRRCVSLWAALGTLLLLSLGNGKAIGALTGALALSEASIVADTLLDRLDNGFNL